VADEEYPVTSEATAGPPLPADDPRDDWLAESDADDLEWFPPAGGTIARLPGRPVPPHEAVPRVRATGPVPAGPSDLLRRRGIAIALLAAVVVAVVLAIVAFGGGSGSKPPATTGITTPPPTTTASTGTTTQSPPPATTTSGTSTSPTTTSSTPAVTVVVPAVGYLKPGDTGADVSTLQKALVALGIASLTPDGNFGPATERAVAAFQRAHGLTADGVVGGKTVDALNAALGAQG
jgi:hypothetical protein